MENRPIKRSPELVALSRDHHQGLLLCWKIRTGLSKDIEPDRIKDLVIAFYKNHLQKHFKEEEQYLFPVLEADNKYRLEAEQQHDHIVSLINNLQNQENELVSILQKIEKALEKHIRFEERELFNLIELKIDTDQLKTIGSHLENTNSEMEWKDKYWLKEN